MKFTEQEKELLRKHLDFYKDLDWGFLSPTTEDQEHFVAVCRGEKEPETEHEHAYTKYLAKKQKAKAKKAAESAAEREAESQARTHTRKLAAQELKSERESGRSDDDGIPEYEAGYPTPLWYPGRDNSKLNPYGRNSYKRK